MELLSQMIRDCQLWKATYYLREKEKKNYTKRENDALCSALLSIICIVQNIKYGRIGIR